MRIVTCCKMRGKIATLCPSCQAKRRSQINLSNRKYWATYGRYKRARMTPAPVKEREVYHVSDDALDLRVERYFKQRGWD